MGACTVELDELPEIGSFVEVEGPSDEDVIDVQRRLGLADAKPIGPTYAELVAIHLGGAAAHEKQLVFRA